MFHRFTACSSSPIRIVCGDIITHAHFLINIIVGKKCWERFEDDVFAIVYHVLGQEKSYEKLGNRVGSPTLGGIFSALLDQFCHQPCPTCLMAGTQPGTVIAMKIFIEKNEITPVWIYLEHFSTTIHRPVTGIVSQENVYEPVRQLCRYFPQSHLFTRTGGTLHLKVIS